jgi:hypothetical protein
MKENINEDKKQVPVDEVKRIVDNKVIEANNPMKVF